VLPNPYEVYIGLEAGAASIQHTAEVRGMTEIDLSRAEWRKSSFSSQSGNCVEVARNLPGIVAIRDSKEPGRGPLRVESPHVAR
jgi:hypothetical protein